MRREVLGLNGGGEGVEGGPCCTEHLLVLVEETKEEILKDHRGEEERGKEG